MFQIFLGAMDKESVRVVGGNKKGIIDASTLVYKYVFAAGAAAGDSLSRGDRRRAAGAARAPAAHARHTSTATAAEAAQGATPSSTRVPVALPGKNHTPQTSHIAEVGEDVL